MNHLIYLYNPNTKILKNRSCPHCLSHSNFIVSFDEHRGQLNDISLFLPDGKEISFMKALTALMGKIIFCYACKETCRWEETIEDDRVESQTFYLLINYDNLKELKAKVEGMTLVSGNYPNQIKVSGTRKSLRKVIEIGGDSLTVTEVGAVDKNLEKCTVIIKKPLS